jgi:hypothetical protein
MVEGKPTTTVSMLLSCKPSQIIMFTLDQNKSGELGERDHSESPKDEEPLRKPSTNIKGDLVRIIGEKGFKASGSFYASRFFEDTDAPNPILNLEGVGIVGLPLSPRVAKDVISGCQLAPFGKGERTVVDKEVRDTWEMDGAKVRHQRRC